MHAATEGGREETADHAIPTQQGSVLLLRPKMGFQIGSLVFYRYYKESFYYNHYMMHYQFQRLGPQMRLIETSNFSTALVDNSYAQATTKVDRLALGSAMM